MYKQETINPYHEGEKGEQVEQMFDHIAHSYDLLNHALSLGIDRGWRRKAVDSLKEHGYTIEEISYDLHNTYIDNIMTEYEEKFSNMGIKIKYLKATK